MTNLQILDAINQNIKRNENKEITGVILNSVLRMLLDFVNQGFITFSDIIQLLADSKAINVVGSINTTTNTTSLPSGVYHTQTSGTYTNASGIVVKEGYYTLLRKKDDGSWVLESEVKMPMQDLTKIETELESTKTKVDEFIENFAVTTDTEFNAESNNPIANETVTPLADVLESFIKNDSKKIDASNFRYGYIKNNGEILVEKKQNGKYIEITDFKDSRKIQYKAYKMVVTDANYSLYSSVLAVLADGSTIQLLDTVLSSIGQNNQVITDVVISLPANTNKLLIGWSNWGVVDNPSFRFLFDNKIDNDSVKKYIDKSLSPIDYFQKLREVINTRNYVTGYIRNDGVIEAADQNSRCVEIKNLKNVEQIYFRGYRTIVSSRNLDTYSNIIAITIDDKAIPLLACRSNELQQEEEFLFDLPKNTVKLLVSWANFKDSINVFPLIELRKEQSEEDVFNSVKKYIDNSTSSITKADFSDGEFVLPETMYTIDVVGQFPTDNSPTRTPTDVLLKFYIGSQIIHTQKAEMSIQGQASAAGIVTNKNFTFDFFDDNGDEQVLCFHGSVSADSLVVKSFHSDPSKIIEQCSFKLWHKIRTSDSFPNNRIDTQTMNVNNDANVFLLNEDSAKFYPYGFYVRLMNNGNFHNVAVLRLKKGRNNYRFDRNNKKHIFLNFDYTLPNNGGEANMLSFNKFKPEQWELRNPKLKGYDAGDVIEDEEVMSSINGAWSWMSSVYNNKLTNKNPSNINIKSWVDYLITAELIWHEDGLDNNIFIASWADSFQPLIYDAELTLGRSINGVSTNIQGLLINAGTRGALFWQRFHSYYREEIKARYTELRNRKTIDIDTFNEIVENEASKIPAEFLKENNDKWGYYINGKPNSMQILIFLNNRIKYLDTQWKL